MNRTKFFKKLTVNGVEELDYLWNTLSSFKMNHTKGYYRIRGDEVGQPDLISYRIYGTERYWWIICLVNQINSPLTDIVEGSVIELPDVRDIYDFYQNFANR